jgi:hypothetical protein
LENCNKKYVKILPVLEGYFDSIGGVNDLVLDGEIVPFDYETGSVLGFE